MNTHLTEETIYRFSRRTLGPLEILNVDDHIADCGMCRAALAHACDADALLASLLSQFRPTPSQRLRWFPSSPVRPPTTSRRAFKCVV